MASGRRERDGEALLARLQRLQVRDQDLLGHDRAGAEHLGAAHGHAFRILVHDPHGHLLARLLAPRLGAVALRIDDDVAEVEVVVARIRVVVAERGGVARAVALKDLDPHHLARDRRRQMIGRAAQVARMKLGPGSERLPPGHQLGVAARHLPGAVHAPPGLGLEGHALDVGRSRLEVVKSCGRTAGRSESRMVGDARDQLAVEVDRPVLVECAQVRRAVLDVHRSIIARSRSNRDRPDTERS